MSFFVGEPAVVGAPGDIHSTQQNPVGLEATDAVGNIYKYLPGVASTVAGSWAKIGKNG